MALGAILYISAADEANCTKLSAQIIMYTSVKEEEVLHDCWWPDR